MTEIGRVHYGYLILTLVVLSVFSALGLGRFGYSMVLPAMRRGLDLPISAGGQLQGWTSAGYLLTVVFAGILATEIGPRKVITASLAIVGLSMLATGVVERFPVLCLARFFTGIGGAGANVPAMGLVSAWFVSRRRGLAAGAAVSGSSLGLFFSGFSVPVILARYGEGGWRFCWFLFGVMALLSAVLVALFMRNSPSEMGLGAMGGGASGSGPDGSSGGSWREVSRSNILRRLAVVYFAFGFSYIIYATFLVSHLVDVLGMSQSDAGAWWMRIGLASIVSGFLWGSFSDRIGRRGAIMCISVLQAFSYLTIGFFSGTGAVFVSSFLFAVTAWSIPAVLGAAAGDVFGARLAPAAIGLVTIVFGVGQTLGPFLGGILADRAGSFAPAFILAGAVILILGAGGATALPRRFHEEG